MRQYFTLLSLLKSFFVCTSLLLFFPRDSVTIVSRYGLKKTLKNISIKHPADMNKRCCCGLREHHASVTIINQGSQCLRKHNPFILSSNDTTPRLTFFKILQRFIKVYILEQYKPWGIISNHWFYCPVMWYFAISPDVPQVPQKWEICTVFWR